MNSYEDYLFWKLAESFIIQSGYRVVKLFPDEKEFWLEKKESAQAPIVRLCRSDFGWSSVMARDVERTAATGAQIRSQLRLRNLRIFNIYISEQPPVDDYHPILSEPFLYRDRFSETSVQTILFANGTFRQAMESLSLSGIVDASFMNLSNVTDLPPGDAEEARRRTLEYAVNASKREQAIFTAGKPFFTYIFMVIQVLVFLLVELYGGSTNPATLIKFGAKFNPLILEGEWWRFITPVFLHIGFLHLAMNTIGLYFVGTAVERMLGSPRFLFVYLFAGFGGSLASFLFSHEISAGASGAIFGCLGALLYFGMVYPRLFYRTMGHTVFVIIIVNLAFGFSVSMVDNAGHLGGLAAGFLGAGIVHFPKKRKTLSQIIFAAASILLAAALLQHGFKAGLGPKDEHSVILLAQEKVNKENYREAYSILSRYEKGNKVTEKTYFLLSYTEIKLQMLADAKAHLLKAIALDNNFPEAHFNLALIYLEERDLVSAKKHAEIAESLKPGQKEYQNLVEEIGKALSGVPGS
ncbi:rhomboid family intramembrane serine protease [Neobacillus piezotolerans]|uniref:Rhomboid family intramembrane serine protease n=1 Tax=Neobacillus piezotolerans TaxID=2259171 RepID=A0A3D8GM97_9BACI|nr:rhomboid family intramembrane serine protease [Neobacillus piezotolerans]RDU35462.1 rhomboid family intramembrane serine protease [Neobacillus piezotolerans]